MSKFAEAFQRFEDSIWDIVPGFVGKLFFEVKQPKVVSIRSPVLGIIEKSLLGLVLAYVIMNIISSGSHFKEEMPTGFPTFDFIRKAPNDAAFNDQRNLNDQPYVDLPYCNVFHKRGEYEYLRPIYDSTGTLLSPYKNFTKTKNFDWVSIKGSVFNDDKIACKQINYAELIKKGLFTAQLTTFQSETLSTVHRCEGPSLSYSCSDPAKRETDDAKSTIITKYSGEDYFKSYESGGNVSCTCLEKKNSFPMAPEYIGLAIYHDYQGSSDFGGVTGTTTIKKNSNNLAPDTYVKRKVYGGKHLPPMSAALEERLKQPFKPGDAIQLSVNELLEIAGCNLDESVSETSIPLVQGQPPPKRRTAGVRLKVEFEYDINVDTDDAACTMYVSFIDGLTSWSQDVQMHSRQKLSEPKNMEDGGIPDVLRQYSEFTNRGVMIQFSAHGKLKKFDVNNFVNVVIQGIVLMGPVYSLILILATMVMPAKKVYSQSLREKVEYTKSMGQAATMAALLISQFNDWGKQGKLKQNKKINVQALSEILSQSLGETEGGDMAKFVFEASPDHENTPEELSCEEMIRIMTGDVLNFGKIQRKMTRKKLQIHPVNRNNGNPNNGTPYNAPAPDLVAAPAPAVQPQIPGMVQAPQARAVNVTCPPGIAPGGMLQVQTPNGMVQVQVPNGVSPGQVFQIQY